MTKSIYELPPICNDDVDNPILSDCPICGGGVCDNTYCDDCLCTKCHRHLKVNPAESDLCLNCLIAENDEMSKPDYPRGPSYPVNGDAIPF